MPRRGWTSITVPIEVYNELVSFCSNKGIDSLGKCIYFLKEFYESVVKDPNLPDYVREKKVQRVIDRVERQWKTILGESKAAAQASET